MSDAFFQTPADQGVAKKDFFAKTAYNAVHEPVNEEVDETPIDPAVIAKARGVNYDPSHDATDDVVLPLKINDTGIAAILAARKAQLDLG